MEREIVVSQYRNAAARFGVADLSARSRISASGPDAPRFINNLCTNDVARLEPGAGCEAFFLNAKGQIIDYARVLKAEDELLLDVEPGRGEQFFKQLDRYLIREKVVLKDRTADLSQLMVFGAESAARLGALGVAVDSLEKPLQWISATIGDVACRIVRSNRGAIPAFEIFVAADVKDALIASLAGEQVGPQVLEAMRIEAGVPVIGVDFDGGLPQELDRVAQSISFTKGCYLGQETVARLDAYGHVNKILRGLEISTEEPPAAGSVILFGEKEVGRLGSSTPSARGVRGLAVLRVSAAAPGTEVLVRSPTGDCAAVVSGLPFPPSA